jgi:5-methylcytosine-specific restriction endonuclease McrA
MTAMRILPLIPPDPEPTEKEIDAQLQKHKFSETLSLKMQRKAAAFYWRADQKIKNPDLFWWPFAPEKEEYDKYRASEQWLQIREKVKQAAGYKCACCPNRATEVHHRCYRPRVMLGEDTSLLIALCSKCHKTVDFDANNKSRDANSKERVLRGMFDRETARLSAETVSREIKR